MNDRVPRWIGRLAVEALVAEATLAPKPGLVTPFSQGAHADMDYRMLVASARALGPCFEGCARAGLEAAAAHRDPGTLLDILRPIGLAGEDAMNRATGGVNAHKGGIFCVGLLGAAVGFLHGQGRADVEGGFELVAGLCAGLVARELDRPRPGGSTTAGERLYREQGTRGARGQAEDGYPLLRDRLLPILRDAGREGGRRNPSACLDALLVSMRDLEDSCLLARGGPRGLALAQSGADEVLRLGGAGSARGLLALRDLDRTLCRAGLSPGGSADMLAAGMFLVDAENLLETLLGDRRRIA